ncbi:MAG: hypothetical protein KDK33_10270 [Leptospiraceae bacterium]|nr:hypothetical protein [Leptospiraceae bacterium]
MPPAILDTVEDPELKAQYLAYFKLLHSVLGKRPGSPEQKQQLLAALQKELVERATNVDALIEEIPHLASRLGVPAQSLSTFVSQNFFKALEMAHKELKAEANSNGPAASGNAGGSPADPERDHDLIQELLERFGPIVEAPSRFEPADMGLIKLKTPNGERLPASLSGGSPAQPQEQAETAAVPAEKSSAPAAASAGVKTNAPPPRAAPVLPPLQEDVHLIEEILNKFGNHLDVHQKLEPSAFPENFSAESDSDSVAPAQDAAPAQQQPAASGGVKTNAPPPRQAPVLPPLREDQHIIEELLNKFGNVLNIQGRLEPSDGLATGGAAAAPSSAAANRPETPSNKAATAQNLGEVEPRAIIGFARYTEIRSRLAQFQKTGDQNAYKQFLQQLDSDEKLVVPLRNLENRLNKDPSLKPSDELYHLSINLSIDAARLAGFRQAMIRYDRIQLLLNDFVQRVKKGPAPLMKAVQQIWPQVRLLLNQVEDLSAMKSQMKILLLGIADPEVKKRTQEIVESLLNRAHSIYAD